MFLTAITSEKDCVSIAARGAAGVNLNSLNSSKIFVQHSKGIENRLDGLGVENVSLVPPSIVPLLCFSVGRARPRTAGRTHPKSGAQRPGDISAVCRVYGAAPKRVGPQIPDPLRSESGLQCRA